MNWSNALPAENAILLQSGTNEVEVLVFRVGGFTLGINVAKVREVLTSPPVIGSSHAHGLTPTPPLPGAAGLRLSLVGPPVLLERSRRRRSPSQPTPR